MSEAVAAAIAPAPAAPVVIPPAEQPPAPVREKSFAERWKEHGGEEAEAADVEAPEAEPEKPAAEAKPRNADPTAGDRAMFDALAKKLGYHVDGKAVLPTDRIKWEQAKKRQEEGLAAREKAVKDAEAAAGSNERVKKAESILAAIESGDPDGFAAAVGRKNFNEFQEEFIKRLADPNYTELKRLKEWKEQQEQERVKAAEEAKQREESEVRERMRAGYMDSLSKTCAASSNPLVAALAEDPNFLQAVFRIQQENWDPVQQKTVTAEEAIRKAAKGAKQPLEDELRGIYERLGKGFGAATPAPEASPPKGKRPAPKTAVTPPNTTGGASAPKKPSDMTPLEWREYSRKRLEESED